MLGGYRISQTLHVSGTRLPRHDHEDPSINIVLRGGFLERIGSREFRGSPGTLIVKPAGAHHSDQYSPSPTVTILVHRPLSSLHTLGPTARAFGEVRLLEGAKAGKLAMALKEVIHGSPTAALDAEIALDEVLLELAGRTAVDERAPRAAPWLARIRDQLVAGATSQISLTTLARAEGVSLTAVSTAFKRAYGLTPRQFTRAVRVDRARQLLRDADVTLSSIAHATGFADQAHLTRSFKRETALTPGQYRRAEIRTCDHGSQIGVAPSRAGRW